MTRAASHRQGGTNDPVGARPRTRDRPAETKELTPAGANSGGVNGQYRLDRSGYYRSDPPRPKPHDHRHRRADDQQAADPARPPRALYERVAPGWSPAASSAATLRPGPSPTTDDEPPAAPVAARIWTSGAAIRGAHGPPRRRPGGVDPGPFHVVSQPCPPRHQGCRRWAVRRRTPSSCPTGRRSRGARSSPSPLHMSRRTRC